MNYQSPSVLQPLPSGSFKGNVLLWLDQPQRCWCSPPWNSTSLLLGWQCNHGVMQTGAPMLLKQTFAKILVFTYVGKLGWVTVQENDYWCNQKQKE